MATVAYSLGAIISGAFGNEYPIPAWGDVTNPQPQDNRTTQDIVQGLIEKLT